MKEPPPDPAEGQLPPVVIENIALRALANSSGSLLLRSRNPEMTRPEDWDVEIQAWFKQCHALDAKSTYANETHKEPVPPS